MTDEPSQPTPNQSGELPPDELKQRVRGARGRFMSMATAYSLGAFNDNFYKQAAGFLAIAAAKPELRAIAAALFSLPYVLLAAHAGWLADRFPKGNVVIASKILELVAVVIGAVGLLYEIWPLVLTMIFIMGTQATIFGPALNGSIPDLYPPQYVTTANAFLRMGVTSAILLGMVMAGVILNEFPKNWLGEIALSKWIIGGVMIVILVLGLITAMGTPRRSAANPHLKFPVAGPVDTVRELIHIHKDGLLAKIVWADGFIWTIGASQLLIIMTLGREELKLNEAYTSYMMFMEMIGIAFGGWLSSKLAVGPRWHWVLGPCAIIMAALTFLTPVISAMPDSLTLGAAAMTIRWKIALMTANVFVLGLVGGIFLVPCESFVQTRPAREEKGEVIAVANFVAFIGIIIFAGIISLVEKYMSPSLFMAIMGIPSLAMGIWLICTLRKYRD